MKVDLSRDFSFEAAHRLPEAPEGHTYRRLHGHSYTVTIEVRGEVEEETGWVMDFADIEEAWQPLLHRIVVHETCTARCEYYGPESGDLTG